MRNSCGSFVTEGAQPAPRSRRPCVATRALAEQRFGSRAAAAALPVYSNISVPRPPTEQQTLRREAEARAAAPSARFPRKCPARALPRLQLSRLLPAAAGQPSSGGRQEMSQLVYAAPPVLPGSWLSEGTGSCLLRSLWLQVSLWMSAAPGSPVSSGPPDRLECGLNLSGRSWHGWRWLSLPVIAG